jgi:DNA-binding MarR family transcriptional regulator
MPKKSEAAPPALSKGRKITAPPLSESAAMKKKFDDLKQQLPAIAGPAVPIPTDDRKVSRGPLPTAARGIILFTHYVRENLTSDFPMNQLALLLAVAREGDQGETLEGLGKALRMFQGSVSKNAKMLSRWAVIDEDGTRRDYGHGLLRSEPDLIERKRMRVFLTEEGKLFINVLLRCLSGEFKELADLPGKGGPA